MCEKLWKILRGRAEGCEVWGHGNRETSRWDTASRPAQMQGKKDQSRASQFRNSPSRADFETFRNNEIGNHSKDTFMEYRFGFVRVLQNKCC